MLKWSIGSDRTKADIESALHPAGNAIDGDTNTFTEITPRGNPRVSSWYGRLEVLSTIEYITLHLPTYLEYPAHRVLIIQTSVNAHFDGPWIPCARKGSVKESPLNVSCNAEATKANTVRIWNRGSMKLNEVEVYGSEV